MKSREFLNIGCGNVKIVSAINMDMVENDIVKPDVVGNVLDIPFDDERFKGVIFSHVLEHLDKNNHVKALSEIRRVLKPNGKAYIEVPDFLQFMKNYMENYLGRKDYWYNGIYGRVLYESDRHLSGIDETYLTDLLFNCSFTKLEWANSPRRVASLIVMATKAEVGEKDDSN